ncbi:MAG TPA: hypothetical protein DEF51_23630 [Myxococcales bacterium]|nr:hypothetical protein [Myxococcales bacterium]
MTLTPRQRRQIRRATRPRHLDPSEQGGELNIVPFLDIVVNVMLFLLATTTAAIAVAQVDVELPATCVGCGGQTRSLNLSVTVGEEGVFVSGEGAHLAPGCAETTPRAVVTVPRTTEGHDFEALRACLDQVHQRFPEEDSLILTADPTVPYADVIRAMDAARGDDHTLWFPRVRLSAGVR